MNVFGFIEQIPFDILARPDLQEYFRADHDAELEYVLFQFAGDSGSQLRNAICEEFNRFRIRRLESINQVKTNGSGLFIFPGVRASQYP